MHTLMKGHKGAAAECRRWAQQARRLRGSIEGGLIADTATERQALRTVIEHLDGAIEALVDLHGPDDEP